MTRGFLEEINLYYSIDGGYAWTKVMMSHTGDSTYEAIIPQQEEETMVQYYVKAGLRGFKNLA